MRALIPFLLLGCSEPEPVVPAYVGSETCVSCHPSEGEAWTGSDHQRALLAVTPDQFPGDRPATFEHPGGVDHMQAGQFKGPDGEGRVAFQIGVDPLEQFLVDDNGTYRVLDTSYVPGTGWLRLHPGIASDDALHWTANAFVANHQCLECHTTGYQKNYDDGAYKTEWAEIGVGCEACHGRGAEHVAWAKDGGEGDPLLRNTFPERAPFQLGDSPIATSTRTGPSAEPNTCARCHSRRSTLVDGSHAEDPLEDTHRTAVLRSDLYWPDGAVLDEVYVWGSFVQSKMHEAGVTCSDCHDPHSGAVRAPADDPSAVCSTCHQPATYAAVEHTHHENVSCVDCHMPQTTFMQVDPRRDHSMRVPRPDLPGPSACASCHEDEDASAAAIVGWLGKLPDTFGARYATRSAIETASDTGMPDIYRASAVAQLPPTAMEPFLSDPSPLVRREAARALTAGPPGIRRIVEPLLSDPTMMVRVDAARAAIGASISSPAYGKAKAEYQAAMRVGADTPMAWMDLAESALRDGKLGIGIGHLQRAVAIDPTYAPAWANLADMQRNAGGETEARVTLTEALKRFPENAALHHAMGLSYVRTREAENAVRELEIAVQLDPNQSRYAWVLATAQDAYVSRDIAIATINDALTRHPNDPRLTRLLIELQQ